MKTTILIGLSLGFAGFWGSVASAQALSNANPPAEFPPASYSGRQYVDSKGCVYIRAGVNGNVSWVPRVTRKRQQVCGAQPTFSQPQQAQAAPARPAAEPEEIRIEPAQTATAPAAVTTPAASPTPKRVRRTPSAGPEATVFRGPDPVVAATPKPAPKPRRVAAPRPAPVAAPQVIQPTPVIVKPTPQPTPQPRVVQVAEANPVNDQTRVLRRHVFENRLGSEGVRVLPGYRSVWEDGRLNPRRAERTLAPSVAEARPQVPNGFRAAWDDERLSYRRGVRTAAGDAQTDQLWTRELPRRQVAMQTNRQIVRVSPQNGNSPFWTPEVRQVQPAPVTRLSTRSQTATTAKSKPTKPSYVRVAVYANPADAAQTARAFASAGLPMRMGRLTRQGQEMKVVLAGPFASRAEAKQALVQVKNAGFRGARLNR
ncbi:MAG: SPOR domain-containing protein [Sedimentitalea sp.]